MPPAFAFAPWNDAIFGSANVRRVAREAPRGRRAVERHLDRGLARRGLLAGASGGNAYQLKEEWDVDRTLYPDFESVASELHGNGFKWLVYFNSFVEQDSKAWPETAPNGYLIAQARRHALHLHRRASSRPRRWST